jgi:hypothetical protein
MGLYHSLHSVYFLRAEVSEMLMATLHGPQKAKLPSEHWADP